MTFRDWQDVEASKPLDLPIRGKKYRIPALGHLDEIALRENMDRIKKGDAPTLGNEEVMAMLLGERLAEMRADNVPDQAILHAATVAHTYARSGLEAAENLWEHGPSPEAVAAAIQTAAQIASKARDGSTTSPSTAAAALSTRKPASTSGTRSRPAKKAPPSRGSRSSSTRS